MKSSFTSSLKTARFIALDTLASSNVAAFRESFFKPQIPIVLPRGQFRNLPAISRWFAASSSSSPTDIEPSSFRSLNYDYLEQFRDSHVPLELTTKASNGSNTQCEESFKRFHAPLSFFLDWTRSVEDSNPKGTSQKTGPANIPNVRLYLAQCQLLDLAAPLRDDFPAPPYVTDAGKGDIYDTNVWIGIAPTYTPLHRDPNPNIFVQLAGAKHIRLLSPNAGLTIYDSVRARVGKSGGVRSAAFRGEDMMHGLEKELLDQAIWGKHECEDGDQPVVENASEEAYGYEVLVTAGDGVFIPTGWWHSIKGVGEGITASVNWWFR
ncbi:hypothetical protein PRK78_000990 [Emydomyces testavorans]|uniref:Cupin-like domain-containing protein n=1 Tax=Emydomyces testavorans TaxID=2070801 RepID=A0AAF0II70_9EURO|nr:hypothetical protein PRK78_000990 [Emydomyces testavorans]